MPTNNPSSPKPLTLEEYKKLRQALNLIADVQCPHADEFKEDDYWRGLYRIRVELGRQVYYRRPHNWAEVGEL